MGGPVAEHGVQGGAPAPADRWGQRRGMLGDGPPPGPADLDRAIRLSRLITAAAAHRTAAHALGVRGRARGPRVPGPGNAAAGASS